MSSEKKDRLIDEMCTRLRPSRSASRRRRRLKIRQNTTRFPIPVVKHTALRKGDTHGGTSGHLGRAGAPAAPVAARRRATRGRGGLLPVHVRAAGPVPRRRGALRAARGRPADPLRAVHRLLPFTRRILRGGGGGGG